MVRGISKKGEGKEWEGEGEGGKKKGEERITKEGRERKGCRGEKHEGTRDLECGEGKKNKGTKMEKNLAKSTVLGIIDVEKMLERKKKPGEVPGGIEVRAPYDRPRRSWMWRASRWGRATHGTCTPHPAIMKKQHFKNKNPDSASTFTRPVSFCRERERGRRNIYDVPPRHVMDPDASGSAYPSMQACKKGSQLFLE